MNRLMAVLCMAAAILILGAGVALADRPYQDSVVSPENGGGLLSDNGQLDWQLPPGSYSNQIRLRFTQRTLFDLPALPAGSIWVGQPFSLQMFDWDSGLLIAAEKPATLNVHYRPEELGGRSEATLRIVRYYDQWVALPSTVDTANHVVVAQSPYSGDYGLIADDAPPIAPPAQPAPPTVPVPEPGPTPEPVPVVTPPAGAEPTPQPGSSPVYIPSAESTIAGRVYFDRNGNGAMDGDDFPVGGAGVLLTSGELYVFVRTNADGYYSFRYLEDGTYTVNVVVGPEWTYTTPNQVSDLAVSSLSNPVKIADFGIRYRMP